MAARPIVCTVVGDRRVRPKVSPGNDRVKKMYEAEPTFSLAEAVAEANRCAATTTCMFCDVCELMCPDLAITRHKKTGSIVIDLDYCKGCGLCAHYCPRGAIEMVVDREFKLKTN